MSLQLPCSAVLKYLMLQGIVCFGGGDVWLDWEKDRRWVCFGEKLVDPPSGRTCQATYARSRYMGLVNKRVTRSGRASVSGILMIIRDSYIA